jgi:hypothetical protein
MKNIDPTYANVVYNDPGNEPWKAVGKMQKNGQRRLSVSKLEPQAKISQGPSFSVYLLWKGGLLDRT